MTKSELKTGMIVVLANGMEYMVYKGIKTSYGNYHNVIVATDGTTNWDDLDSSYREDLTTEDHDYHTHDIVRVFQVTHPYAFVNTNYEKKDRKVLWEKKKQYTYAQLKEILGTDFEIIE